VSSLHPSHNNPNGDGTLPHLNGRLSLNPSHNGDRVLLLNLHPPPPAAEAPRPVRRRQRVQEPIVEETIEEEPTDSDDNLVTETLPDGEYALEFNRSPVVGNRFRLRSVYSEARLAFTRPRGWNIKSAKP
jgi:hypothetical protein